MNITKLSAFAFRWKFWTWKRRKFRLFLSVSLLAFSPQAKVPAYLSARSRTQIKSGWQCVVQSVSRHAAQFLTFIRCLWLKGLLVITVLWQWTHRWAMSSLYQHRKHLLMSPFLFFSVLKRWKYSLMKSQHHHHLFHLQGRNLMWILKFHVGTWRDQTIVTSEKMSNRSNLVQLKKTKRL